MNVKLDALNYKLSLKIELPLSQMLKGNQKKIDANKDGKISKKDFLLLKLAKAKKKNGNKSA